MLDSEIYLEDCKMCLEHVCQVFLLHRKHEFSLFQPLRHQLTNVKTHEVLKTRTYIALREDMQMDVFSVFLCLVPFEPYVQCYFTYYWSSTSASYRISKKSNDFISNRWYNHNKTQHYPFAYLCYVLYITILKLLYTHQWYELWPNYYNLSNKVRRL